MSETRREILRTLIQAALDKSLQPPPLTQEKTNEYIAELAARGITARAAFWHRDGTTKLARIDIIHRSPEIDAEIARITGQ